MFFWYLDSFYGTVISAAALAYAFIKLKGSFSYARNRAKMYDLFSMAIRSVGYEEISLVIAKYMDTICGMFIARMILKDTGNLDKWDNLKKKAKLARKTKRLTKPKL